jgi:hypothetical protein
VVAVLPLFTGAVLVLVSLGTGDGVPDEGELDGDPVAVGLLGGVGDGDTVVSVADGVGEALDGGGVGAVVADDGLGDGLGVGHPGAGVWL